MRLLFVALTPPLPANNGHRMRIWALLRALGEEGHETDLITLAEPQDAGCNSPELRAACREVEPVAFTLPAWAGNGGYRRRLAALAARTPYGAARFRSDVMAGRIAARLSNRRYDAIFAETPYTAINFPACLSAPLIVDDQNIEHVLIERYLRNEPNPARRAYAWLEWRKLRNWESRICSRARLILVCSENDRAGMRRMCPERPAAVVPNIIDVDSYESLPPVDNQTVVYVGGMDWFPNRDAVEFFATEILPELRRLAPGIRFIVVHSPDRAGPEEFRHRLPGVAFVASNDVRAEIAKAAVFAAPIRVGSGTRFKILEAAAMAKPIVSTRVGAEGLEFGREQIVLEDEPGGFARAVAALLADRDRRAALGLAARRTVEQHYSFAVLRNTLRSALSVLNGARGREGVTP